MFNWWKKAKPRAHDPEDMFADTRMSFGDHLEELRGHLWRAVSGFLIAMIFGLFLSPYVLEIIAEPVRQQLSSFQGRLAKRNHQRLIEESKKWSQFEGRRVKIDIELDREDLLIGLRLKPAPKYREPDRVLKHLANDLLRPLAKGNFQNERTFPITAEVPDPRLLAVHLSQFEFFRPPTLSTMSVTEAVIGYFKVAMLCGLVLGSPWIFFEIWSFIAAGLYPHEKRVVNVYLPFSVGLFIIGVVVCQIWVMPKAVEALLWFNEWLGFSADLRFNVWLGFAIMMPVVFGISFQTPLVMMFLNRVGLMDVDSFRKYRKVSWFVMAIFAALITPTPDIVNMSYLWIPMGLLYELGILICVFQSRHQAEESPELASGGLFEV